MDRPVSNERHKPRVAEQAPEPAGLRHGGSVVLPAGATQEQIDNALRGPASEPAPAAEEESQ